MNAVAAVAVAEPELGGRARRSGGAAEVRSIFGKEDKAKKVVKKGPRV